jgi:LysM repeat protein
METARRSPLRFLAPVAIIAFALALFLLVSSANDDSGGSSSPSPSAAEKARDLGTPAQQRRAARKRKARSSGNLPQRIYIVKSGDTLGSIAVRTGVPVQKLQDLNPGLDQFSLVTGQKIKIR